MSFTKTPFLVSPKTRNTFARLPNPILPPIVIFLCVRLTFRHTRITLIRIRKDQNIQTENRQTDNGRKHRALYASRVEGWNNYGTLHTSTNPPRSLTNTYNLYRSSGCLLIVGHAVIGVRRSSINASSLSSQPRRSGFSSMSYSLHRLSDFFVAEAAVAAAGVAAPLAVGVLAGVLPMTDERGVVGGSGGPE